MMPDYRINDNLIVWGHHIRDKSGKCLASIRQSVLLLSSQCGR